MTRVRVLALLALALTFVAGIGVGIFLRDQRPAHSLPPPLDHLELDDRQAAEVRRILAAHRPALDDAVREAMPRIREIQDGVEQEIRAVLTEDQRRELDELRANGAPPPPLPGSGP